MKIDLELTKNKLVSFIRDEASKIGVDKLILGLSGGIDSALSAALASEAIGGENVYSFALPYKNSSQASMDDAVKVAEAFKLNFDVIEITDMVDPYFAKNEDISKLRMGNVMARQRMICLFDMSAKFGGIVLGTSNKSEILLGYGTLHGDLAAAINPLGELYKTHVWELSSYLGVPQSVIDKKPTADLWEGQTDEDELGFGYLEVDKLLYQIAEEKCDKQKLMAMGYAEDFIDDVTDRIAKNRFKGLGTVIAKLD